MKNLLITLIVLMFSTSILAYNIETDTIQVDTIYFIEKTEPLIINYYEPYTYMFMGYGNMWTRNPIYNNWYNYYPHYFDYYPYYDFTYPRYNYLRQYHNYSIPKYRNNNYVVSNALGHNRRNNYSQHKIKNNNIIYRNKSNKGSQTTQNRGNLRKQKTIYYKTHRNNRRSYNVSSRAPSKGYHSPSRTPSKARTYNAPSRSFTSSKKGNIVRSSSKSRLK